MDDDEGVTDLMKSECGSVSFYLPHLQSPLLPRSRRQEVANSRSSQRPSLPPFVGGKFTLVCVVEAYSGGCKGLMERITGSGEDVVRYSNVGTSLALVS
jgi:hypothetical protein